MDGTLKAAKTTDPHAPSLIRGSDCSFVYIQNGILFSFANERSMLSFVEGLV
jgi:hypothetical protein